ncbi:hypothetical protein E2C01_010929 [Portunus trituberculatus]|uniref:Uncharacterized protein n=1 Tax=Portunus trituberculatus TaxID=210409 RepID=A0A5B7D9X9_PORTR|nr:hypothetical protein [Portunus trituberculatus]
MYLHHHRRRHHQNTATLTLIGTPQPPSWGPPDTVPRQTAAPHLSMSSSLSMRMFSGSGASRSFMMRSPWYSAIIWNLVRKFSFRFFN